MTTAFRFRRDVHDLFGLMYSTVGSPRPVAVLIAGPLGHEAIQANRLIRTLGSMLGRKGYQTMRFDYAGSGDSCGEDDQISLDGIANDCPCAARELLARTACDRLVVIGIRLGANVALRSALSGALKASALILWDPIVDGRGYLRDFSSANDRYIAEDLGLGVPELQGRSSEAFERGEPFDAFGMRFSSRLIAEVSALSFSIPKPNAIPISIILPEDADPDENLDSLPGVVRLATPDWMFDDILSPSNIPQGTLSFICRIVERTT